MRTCFRKSSTASLIPLAKSSGEPTPVVFAAPLAPSVSLSSRIDSLTTQAEIALSETVSAVHKGVELEQPGHLLRCPSSGTSKPSYRSPSLPPPARGNLPVISHILSNSIETALTSDLSIKRRSRPLHQQLHSSHLRTHDRSSPSNPQDRFPTP